MLVTLQEAKDHLRIDTDADENDLTIKIKAASKAVQNYLKSTSPYEVELDSSGEPLLDSSGDPIYILTSSGEKIVLEEVRLATLYLVGVYYRERDGQESQEWDLGYLPKPVTSLLYPLRDPAYA